MYVGKRPRPPVTRTTSMTEITFDLTTPNDDQTMMMMTMNNPQPYDPHNPFNDYQIRNNHINNNHNYQGTINYNYSNNNNMGSPRTTYRRNSADFVDTAHFLRSCGLCKRRLVPTRDIYMYRGDTAFCSLECRQQQMSQDERLEKCSLASKKESVSSSASSARSQVAAKGETVVAL